MKGTKFLRKSHINVENILSKKGQKDPKANTVIERCYTK